MKTNVENEFKICVIPKTRLYLNLRDYYILSFVISPLFAFMSIFYDYDIFFLLFLSIYPGTILYFQIKKDFVTKKDNMMNLFLGVKAMKIFLK